MKMMMIVMMLVILRVVVASAQDRRGEMDRVLSAPVSRVWEVRVELVRMEVEGIFVLDGLVWFPVRVFNGSVIDWQASPMRFSIRDRRVLRRRARQEIPVRVQVREEVARVESDSSVRLCYGLMPRLPGKRQDLVLEYVERGGDRRLVLALSRKMILKARKIERFEGR